MVKKKHTEKCLLITNRKKYIYYLGASFFGSCHDFSILKSEFPDDVNWFREKAVLLDLGFLGFGKRYEAKALSIPHKKPRKSKKNPKPELTEEQKLENREISRIRIFVEHAIGGMKRFRILVNRSRIKNIFFKNNINGVCAGLWNFKLKFNQL